MKDKMVLYGAGKRGNSYYDFLSSMGKASSIAYYCDRNASEIAAVHGIKVIPYEDAVKLDLPFVIALGSGPEREAVAEMLKKDGKRMFGDLNEWASVMGYDMVTWNREFCSFYHIEGMDSYFDDAEHPASLDCFWRMDSPFYERFNRLNLENVIELACGRGRHVPKYRSESGHITLVDILERNIEFCKERFKDFQNISYYCNDGYDLKELRSGQYTSLFTYDAMVHFELMDINSYLKETYRLLVPGGRALFHHSNNTEDYRITYASAKHGRNFMSKDVFAFLAYRIGFRILDQNVIDWGGVPGLDCITLVQKPTLGN